MSTTDILIKKLADTINSAPAQKTSPYDTQAEVRRIEGNVAWVHIPGGVDETPVQLTTNAKKGDVVQVRVSGGRAWLYGNQTSPPTDDTKANEVGEDLIKTEVKVYETITITEKKIYNEIEAAEARIGSLEVNKANISDLTAAEARIGDLEADHVSTTDLNAATARIGTLESDHVSVADFQAEQANIDTLQANTADIDTIRANSAKVQNLTAAQLEADHATIGALDTNYAQIDLANVNNAWIQNGVVKNAAIGDAQISGVSANKLTAGTIDASNITVTNLNADNITTGTINGQRIGAGSLSLDKLSEDVYTETEVDNKLRDIQLEIDGAIETYTGTVVPTLNNTPASSWTTTDLKNKHVGDIYYVVNNDSQQNGYCYRFTKSGNVYSWVLIKDSDVTAALQRLTEAEGDISGLQQFETTTSSWISNTDTELNSLKSRTTNVETSLGDKVDSSTFNELSQTVDENSASITSLSTTVQQKADNSTVTTLSNTVNSVQQTANSNSSKISSLTTTLGTNADGTTKAGDIVHRTSAVEQDLSGFKTTVSNTYATKTALNGKADADDLDALTTRVSTAETTITQQAGQISLKANSSDVYTKTATNNLLADKADADDVYTKDAIDDEFALYTKTADFSVAPDQISSTINSAVAGKADASTVYTKSEIDQKVGAINIAVSAKADSAETTASLALKANKDTLTSEINASADTVKINANRLNITGVITAINGDSSTQINGGKIDASTLHVNSANIDGNLLVGQMSPEIRASLNNADNTLIYDHDYVVSNGVATFTAYLYRGGVDVKNEKNASDEYIYPPNNFTWFYKTEDSSSLIPLGTGHTCSVNLSEMGYGGHVIGRYTTSQDSELLTEDDDLLTDSNDNPITARTSSGESVRVSDLTVATTIYSTEKLMVVGLGEEHLVSFSTLQDYLNANLDKQVLFDTTSHWNSQTTLVSDANTLYVYTDHQTDSNNNPVAGIKAGDGSAYVVDLPFTDAVATEHIADTTVHITNAERSYWNNKVRCYYTGVENLVFTTTP